MSMIALRQFLLCRFGRDRRGSSATEFALVLPILVFTYLGSVSAFEGFQARKSVTKASTTIVDLVTRSQVMNESRRDQMYAVADALIDDLADEAPTVTITSVSNPFSEPDANARVVDWSYSNDITTVIDEAGLEDLSIPDIAKGDSMIIVRVYIEHTPRFHVNVFTKREMEQTSFRRPRFILRIPSTIS